MYVPSHNVFLLISLCPQLYHSCTAAPCDNKNTTHQSLSCACAVHDWFANVLELWHVLVCVKTAVCVWPPVISGAAADTRPSGREFGPPTFEPFCGRCCFATSLRLPCSGTSLVARSSGEPWTWPLSALCAHRCPTPTPSDDNPERKQEIKGKQYSWWCLNLTRKVPSVRE